MWSQDIPAEIRLVRLQLKEPLDMFPQNSWKSMIE
ncbi:hypothetical protein glysoja_034180 [Glycine soja]|uniref:Uncharacterized protein n=1 Tax=Glycine soja TaxID=3848 RepID=A0A0B2SWA4_GLYSO|nr:hypothetical protein glysoja_034180 [Glycine soja]